MGDVGKGQNHKLYARILVLCIGYSELINPMRTVPLNSLSKSLSTSFRSVFGLLAATAELSNSEEMTMPIYAVATVNNSLPILVRTQNNADVTFQTAGRP